MTIYKLWSRHRYAAILAVALFLASSAFVKIFAMLAALEYGAASTAMADACRWDCGWYATLLATDMTWSPYRI